MFLKITGTYSCITVDFVFSRHVNYYLVQIFIPVIMTTLVSFCAFWVEGDMLIARLLVNLLALFVMAIQVSSFNEQLPKPSYTRELDIFIGTSRTFAFAALLESITVNYIRRNEPKVKLESSEKADEPSVKKGAKGLDAVKDRMQKLLPKSGQKSKQIDLISRICFSVFFLVFVTIYFAIYCF